MHVKIEERPKCVVCESFSRLPRLAALRTAAILDFSMIATHIPSAIQCVEADY
jgi:hypothetical protein